MATLNFNAVPKYATMSVKGADGQLTEVHPKTDAKITLVDMTNLSAHSTETTVQKAIEGLNSRVDALGSRYKGTVNSESEITAPLTAGWYYVIGNAGTYYEHILEANDWLYVDKDVATGATPAKSDFKAVQGNLLLQQKLCDGMPDASEINDVAENGFVYVEVDPTTL